jgi:hypothetical protein
MPMTAYSVTPDDLADLFRELDSSIRERISQTGATADEVGAALDDLDHERRFCERRVPSSTKIAEIRAILEEATSDPFGCGGGAIVIPIHGDGIVR